MIGFDNLGSAFNIAGDQYATAPDNNDRHRRRACFHAVYRNGDYLHDALLHRFDKAGVKLADSIFVADIFAATGHDHIGCGQHVAAKDERLFRQLVPDTARTNFQGFFLDETAATQANGIGIRHAEVSAHATDIYCQRRNPREAMLQDTNICGGAADIDHDGIFQSR